MAAPRTAARVLVAAAIAATAVLCAVLSTTTAAVATTPPSYDPATTAIAGSHVDVTPGMASFGTALKGVGLHQGVEEELFNRTGAGTMTLMWFTGELIWPTFGDTRIRVYVDGETTPSLDFPVLLAVGQSQPTLQPWGQRRIGNLALSGGVYLTLRIPFGSGIRITAQLPDDEIIKGSKSFYFICRGMTNLPVTWGPLRLPPTARLRLQSLHGYEAAPLEEVRLYKSAVPGSGTGGGALALVTFHGISAKNLTYMEGEVRSYIDGEPLLLSSGTEDFFMSGQYADLGTYDSPIAGCTLVDRFSTFAFTAWKLFEDDPLVWSSDFNMTWRVGEDRGIAPGPTNVTALTWAYEW